MMLTLATVIDWFDANLVNMLNGLAMGALLFTMAIGLSLIFGLMNVLNLAHGALFLVGAYLAYALVSDGGSFWMAAALAVPIGLGGAGLLTSLTRPLAKRGPLDQAIVTLGVAYIVAEVVSIIWGDNIHTVQAPSLLAGSVSIVGQEYPVYRLAVIGFGLGIAGIVYLVFERTLLGATVKAAVADRGMVEALGIQVSKVFTLVFGIGAVLAVLGGVLAAPILGAQPGLDTEVLVLALIVVVVGGLGSISGALVGALIIGQVQTLGVALAPQYASLLLFVAMAVILLVRPGGLADDGGGAR